ncbi:MAG: CsbD family protein [Alphaproteobacteria bacterium]|nr:CsbD family protein [Alphaproteobacteria bacterium]
MNSDILEGRWKELKGEVKRKWGQLTDDQIHQIEGSHDRLIGAIQRSYGLTRHEAEKEVRSWLGR